MLGMNKGISDEADMAHYAYEVLSGHCVPFVSVDLCVVDLSSANEEGGLPDSLSDCLPSE